MTDPIIIGPATLYLGDNLAVMATLPDNSVDAVVTDPPYGLSTANSTKSVSQRIYKVLSKIGFPDLYQRHVQFLQGNDLLGVISCGSDLGVINGSVGVIPGVAVPVSPVDFKSCCSVNQKIHDPNISASNGASDGILPNVIDTNDSQFLGDFILKFGDMSDLSNTGDVPDCCLAEAFFGGFAMPVFAQIASGLPCFECRGSTVTFGDVDIRIDYQTTSQAKGSSGVVAFPGTINSLMLRFDLAGRPKELIAASRASHLGTFGNLIGAQLIRAFPAASGLASMAQPNRVCFVGFSADGTRSDYWFHLWTPRGGKLGSIIPQSGFMGKSWDATLPNPQTWLETFRIAKPGAHMIAFGGARTFHRLVCAIEDAGWEVRDVIMWVHGQGFPKSLAIDKHLANLGEDEAAMAFSDFGSALKPAYEPILLARKPLDGTIAGNVLKHGTGGLNIGACRVEPTGESRERVGEASQERRYTEVGGTDFAAKPGVRGVDPTGRFPANFIHDGSPEVLECFPVSNQKPAAPSTFRRTQDTTDWSGGSKAAEVAGLDRGDSGSAARYFQTCPDTDPEDFVARRLVYGAKASKRDRSEGCEGLDVKSCGMMEDDNYAIKTGAGNLRDTKRSNFHPCVKSTSLMTYLCRLICPPGGTILDPFAGSGSTGKAALLEGFGFIGIEQDPEYLAICAARIRHAHEQPRQLTLDAV